MKLQIIFEKEPTQLQEYKFNFEELKNELSLNLEKYRNLIVSDEAIREAKTTRADLNKLKKEISDKVKEVKTNHLKPFDEFKSKTDQLIRLIDEPVYAIDGQIKNYEQKLKDDILAEILVLWEQEKPSSVQLNFMDQVFKNEWLNVTFSIKKVRQEMIDLTIEIAQDLQVIESFNSEFEVPVKEVYLKNFDMSAAMREKAKYEQRKLEEAERQAQLKAEWERREALCRETDVEKVIAQVEQKVEEDIKSGGNHNYEPSSFEENLYFEKHHEKVVEIPDLLTQISILEGRLDEAHKLLEKAQKKLEGLLHPSQQGALEVEIREFLNPPKSNDIIGEDEIPF